MKKISGAVSLRRPVKLNNNLLKNMIFPNNFVVQTVKNFNHREFSPVRLADMFYPRVSKKNILNMLAVEKNVKNLAKKPGIITWKGWKGKGPRCNVKINCKYAKQHTLYQQLKKPLSPLSLLLIYENTMIFPFHIEPFIWTATKNTAKESGIREIKARLIERFQQALSQEKKPVALKKKQNKSEISSKK